MGCLSEITFIAILDLNIRITLNMIPHDTINVTTIITPSVAFTIIIYQYIN